MLAGTLGIPEFSAHNFLEFPELPAACVCQIHWPREPNFQSWLRAHGFVVITIARHPLDVLLSALHFVAREPQTARWLGGNAGLPGELTGVAPGSPEFLRYALSFGAENLLSVTYQFWHEPDAIKLRYEDLVAASAEKFGALIGRFGGDAARLPAWLGEASLEKMRARTNGHGWRGEPGLWRRLIPPRDAQAIYARHGRVFNTLDYRVPWCFLSRGAAARNWRALA